MHKNLQPNSPPLYYIAVHLAYFNKGTTGVGGGQQSLETKDDQR